MKISNTSSKHHFSKWVLGSKTGPKPATDEGKSNCMSKVCTCLSPVSMQISSAAQLRNTKWYAVRVGYSFLLYFVTSLLVGFILLIPAARDDHPPRDRTSQQHYSGTWFTWTPPDFDYSYEWWNSFAVSVPVAMLIAFCAPLTPLRAPQPDEEKFKEVWKSFFRIKDDDGEYGYWGIFKSVLVATFFFVASALLTLPFYNWIGKSYPDGDFPEPAMWIIVGVVFAFTGILVPLHYLQEFCRINKAKRPGGKKNGASLIPECGMSMLRKIIKFSVSAFLLIFVCGTCILFIEWAVHKNVEGEAFDFDYKGKLDPHHWQYGVLLSCIYVFAPASLHEEGFSGGLTVFLSWCLNALKGVVFGVYLHGLWSYGPDPMLREKGGIRGMWGAGFVWFAVVIFFSAALGLYCVNLHSNHGDGEEGTVTLRDYKQLEIEPKGGV